MEHHSGSGTTVSHLTLRVLGPMELLVSGQRAALPRSKKSRALLAYLAVTERPHHRDRLCALLWDVADDPRGALRWSLSRLRQVLSADVERIEADRQEVALRPDGMQIDACELARVYRQGIASASTPALEQAATLYRGELLEGVELPDFLDFSAWCIAQREQLRRYHCDVLKELVSRLRGTPERALPFARQHALADAFSVGAQQELLRLLLAQGFVEEAHRRFQHAQRLFREVSVQESAALDQAWRALQTYAPPRPQTVPASVPPVTGPGGVTPPLDGGSIPFVGRQRPLSQLEDALGEARATRRTRMAVVTGEPGAGKSRLAERLFTRAGSEGFEVLRARAFEVESTRPFGPWADALTVDVQQLVPSGAPGSRDALFDAFRSRLAGLAEGVSGVLLVLDDVQWLDRDSAELLHYLVRTYDRGPLLVLLLARGGELTDNETMSQVLRSMRRERAVLELELEPLSVEEVAALVGGQPGVDAHLIHRASAGNPLYALELARARAAGIDATPPTLLQLVRERIGTLPDAAIEVLRWGAVLGHAIDLTRLEGLSSLPLEDVVTALERLEQSALLLIDTTRVRERYVFSHDLVREAVYGELSHPRRRLMHRKVALLLEPQATDPALATEIAHHAGLAGEALLGIRACIAAGHYALRVFANSDAEALARRGLRLAEELDEASCVSSTIDLLQVLYSARTPNREEAVAHVRGLAERALDLGLTRAARLGFQTLSYLRWESSSMADAHANILQAERVSRSADPLERTAALAQAARCLLLLEKNLGQAEAFVTEAGAVAHREGSASASVSFALGMIAVHRGEIEASVEAFREARRLSRQQGEHLVEFGALEHHVMVEVDRGGHAEAVELAAQLAELGGRVRPGAEVHVGRALVALANLLHDGSDDEQELEATVEALRRADAKYELSFVLTRWAEHELSRSRLDDARQRATEAIEVASAMGRSSDVAVATTVLAEVAHLQRKRAERARYLAELKRLGTRELSAVSRQRIAGMMSRLAPAK